MGGLHVSFKPEEALHHCDKVVVSEGENVLFDLMNGKPKQDIVKGSKVLDLDSIPIPDYSLVAGLRNPKIFSICTSRGCPFNWDDGIRIQGSFIFGTDYDDKSVFQKTVDFCHDADIDFPTFSALTRYVGTDIRKEFEKNNRIFSNNWDYYAGAHVVFRPKNMTPYELQEGIISAILETQNFFMVLKHFMLNIYLRT